MKNLVRLIIVLGFLALCLGGPVTSALADGTVPYPPLCPQGPCGGLNH